MSREPDFQPGMDEQFTRLGKGDGEDRYWRRQANRRVRKARITRNLSRWTLIVLLQLIFGSVVVYTGHQAWRRISGSKEFALKRIELVGARRTQGDVVRGALSPYLGRGLLDLNLAEIERAVSRDPWVLSASLRRVLPDTLRVEVSERTPCAVAIIGGLAHVVDCRAFVIGPTGLQQADDLPVLTGLPDVDEQRLPGELRRGVDLLLQLRRTAPAFLDEISEMDLSRRDRISLRTVAPGPLLLLDPERVERNLVRFLSLRPAMRERFATAAFVDLRWQDRVSVMPRQPAASNESS